MSDTLETFLPITHMYIRSLTLTNVRQFDQRTYEFRRGFNLLVGENGTGKTTILRGLIAALGGARQLGRRPTLEDEDIRLRALYAEVSAEIVFQNDEVEKFEFRKALWEPAKRSRRRGNLPLTLLYSSNEAICSSMKGKRARRIRGVDGDSLQDSEEFLYTVDRQLSRRPPTSNEGMFGDSQSVRDFVGRVLYTFSSGLETFYWRFAPYDCSLLLAEGNGIPQPLDEKLKKQVRAFAMRKFEENWIQRSKRPFNWPDRAKVVLTPEISDAKSGERGLPKLRDIWKGIKLSSETERKFLESCSLEVKLTPRIMIRRGIGTLTLSQLSDGEQRLFSLFVDIARQLSIDSPDGASSQGQAIVLIDEIDVHLHPKWQRRIVPALEDLFPNCQFIATTHSPFVIQATRRDRITSIATNPPANFFDRGNSIEDIAEDVQGVFFPQRSMRAEQLSAAAKRYFTLLELQATDTHKVNPTELRAAEKSYRKASEPFTSDPAVHALLEVLTIEGEGQ